MRDAHLDGLRGWAAVAVLLSHLYLMLGYPTPSVLPVFIDGHLAVYIFFVLSGHVLTISSYRGSRIQSVLSLAIRRYPRLTIPILVSCFFAAAILWCGLMFNQQAASITGSAWLASFYQQQVSLSHVLQFSLYDVYFAYDSVRSLNGNLWTMHYELVGSFTLFVALIATSWNRHARWLSNLIAILGFFWTGSPLLAFALGWLLASLSSTLEQLSSRTLASITGGAIVICGLAVASVRVPPGNPVELSLLASAVILGMLLMRHARIFLALPLSRWLGAISFPLYLTHLPLICGPLSFTLVKLTGFGVPVPIVHTVIWLGGAGAAVLIAIVFKPVETASINVARLLSNRIVESTIGLNQRA